MTQEAGRPARQSVAAGFSLRGGWKRNENNAPNDTNEINEIDQMN
jgi:hypothetical protein